MPNRITFEEGAGIPLAGQTALQAINKIGNLKPKQKILINGASGGVGTLAIQIAKSLEGEVTTVSSSKNINLCKSLGADHMISYEETNFLNADEKYDIFFDVFGNYSYRKINSILTKHGKYITTVPKADIFKEQIFNFFRSRKAKIVVVKSNSKDMKWLSEMIDAEQIKPVVDKVFSFDEIQTAQAYIETKRAKGKVVLKIAPETSKKLA